ncbi:hypothetical protein AAG570_005017 [Ranatra chinensis]|uniref:Uncharacterized protein n=1 Tax=Ranatra chinensis TaxID=642074 RepID=A0ABD0Y1R8_9HEMI
MGFEGDDRAPNTVDRHYLSEKISVARWKPEGVDGWSERIVTGSWDQPANGNGISLWWYRPPLHTDLPVLDDRVPVADGDVTDIKFVDGENFLYSTSDGSVYMYKLGWRGGASDGGPGGRMQLEEKCCWERLHEGAGGSTCACNRIDTSPDTTDIVTCGQDGRLALLSTTRPGVVQAALDTHDTTSVQAVCFVRHNEIVAGDLRGIIKVWDVRSGDAGGPAGMFPFSRDCVVGVSSLVVLPAQRHILVGGGHNGSLSVWDLRHSASPLLVYNAHELSITDIGFHHTRPSNLFTASETGEIWQWADFDRSVRTALAPRSDESDSTLAGGYDAVTRPPEVQSLLGVKNFPTNSVDANKERLLGSSDSESIVIIHPLVLK